MISVVFTCHKRKELTELCLRRFKELMPEPYELIIVYDGVNPFYTQMLLEVGNPRHFIDNPTKRNRYMLLNDALLLAKGDMVMHLENDFYWVDPSCLTDALKAMWNHPEIDFIRFELLPFTQHNFNRFVVSGGHDVLYMKPETPYRFNFNPHIRKFRFVNGVLFPSPTKGESEQIVNERYTGVSCCMSGDNFRHLGILDEGRNYKEYYSERFFGKRGKKAVDVDDYVAEFEKLTDNETYRKLFRAYLEPIPTPILSPR